MMNSDRFSLRWNNYQSHLVTAFESLLKDKAFVDVTLGCDGRKLPAHKMLLSACSPYFRDLLKDNLCQHPIIVLRDVSHEDMSSLLQFMYNGEVNVTQQQLNSFLKTAEFLKIRGLTDNDQEDMSTPRDELMSTPRQKSTPTPQKRRSDTPPPPKRKRSPFYEVSNNSDQIDSRQYTEDTVDKPLDLGILCRTESVKQELLEVPVDSNLVQSDEALNESVDDYGDIDTMYENTAYLDERSSAQVGNTSQSFSVSQDKCLVGPMPGFNPYMMVYDKPKQFPCPHCDKSYAVDTSLNEHLKVHTGETTCQICKVPQARIATLRRHLRTIHKLAEEEIALMVARKQVPGS